MDYETSAGRIKSSLELGIMAEQDNPALEGTITRLSALETEDIAWIAAWLAGEGFGWRTQDSKSWTEFGVKWVNPPDGVARTVGQIESSGVRPGGSIGQFSEDDCRYIAGTRQRVVSRVRRSLVEHGDWTEVPR